MLYKNRSKFEKLSIRVGNAFSNLGLSPNQWTLLTIIPAVFAFYFLAKESFLLAAGFFALAAFLDLVDGAVARVMGSVTKFGAYLDTVMDRYVEGLVVFGLLFAGLPPFYFQAYVWVFLFLFGGLTTTYVKAAAKEKGLVNDELRGGLLERSERLMLLFAGILLAAVSKTYLTYVVVLLAVLTNISALQRVWIARGAGK